MRALRCIQILRGPSCGKKITHGLICFIVQTQDPGVSLRFAIRNTFLIIRVVPLQSDNNR